MKKYDKYIRLLILLFIVGLLYYLFSDTNEAFAPTIEPTIKSTPQKQNEPEATKKPISKAKTRPSESELRERLILSQSKYQGIKEALVNGKYRNTGIEVEKIQKRAGMPLGQAWCGAYMFCLFEDNGINPRYDFGVKNPSAVRFWFADESKIVYNATNGNSRVGVLPKRGDLLRMYGSHIEMYNGNDWIKDHARRKVLAGGGNTGGGVGIHGVYISERKFTDIKLVSNHITPFYESQN